MRHLGDVCKIKGSEIEPVDCVTFGSPCQDLSVAGNRAGMKHGGRGDDETTRSGLFFEAIRIIREMREQDERNGRTGEFVRPRFAVWENVPGAFSSNGGADFREVLNALIRIAEPKAPDVPLPASGKWPLADAYCGDGWSIAYAVHDLQFWGTTEFPMLQRRRRVCVACDFGGQSAPALLFERKGVSWDCPQGKAQRQGASERTGNCACDAVPDADNRNTGTETTDSFGIGHEPRNETICIAGNAADRATDQNGSGLKKDVSFSLNTVDRHAVCYAVCGAFMGGQGERAGSIAYSEYISPTLRGVLSGGNTVPDVLLWSEDD